MLDNFAPVRDALAYISHEKNEWAGIPMPIEGERLIIEPSYPYADVFAKLGQKDEPVEDSDGWKVRNVWYSHKWRCDIAMLERPDGKVIHTKMPAVHHLDHDLTTLGCSDAWGLDQEQRALQLLGTMIRHRAMKQYILTGSFLESSERSGVTYMFRRLKPTVAIVPDRKRDRMRILAALCMHPIGYYDGSWAGAMTPTDDVVAHLALMRGDEKKFWARCNQHGAHRPEAGL